MVISDRAHSLNFPDRETPRRLVRELGRIDAMRVLQAFPYLLLQDQRMTDSKTNYQIWCLDGLDVGATSEQSLTVDHATAAEPVLSRFQVTASNFQGLLAREYQVKPVRSKDQNAITRLRSLHSSKAATKCYVD